MRSIYEQHEEGATGQNVTGSMDQIASGLAAMWSIVPENSYHLSAAPHKVPQTRHGTNKTDTELHPYFCIPGCAFDGLSHVIHSQVLILSLIHI